MTFHQPDSLVNLPSKPVKVNSRVTSPSKSFTLTNQPYSVQRQAKHLTTADWTWQPSGISSWAPSTTPGYFNASVAYTRDLNSGIHFQELNLTLSRSGLPQPTRRSRAGSTCQTHSCSHSLWTHFKDGCNQSGPGCVWNHWPAGKGISTESENQPPQNREKYGAA